MVGPDLPAGRSMAQRPPAAARPRRGRCRATQGAGGGLGDRWRACRRFRPSARGFHADCFDRPPQERPAGCGAVFGSRRSERQRATAARGLSTYQQRPQKRGKWRSGAGCSGATGGAFPASRRGERVPYPSLDRGKPPARGGCRPCVTWPVACGPRFACPIQRPMASAGFCWPLPSRRVFASFRSK